MKFTYTVTTSTDADTGEERWVQVTAKWNDLALGDPLRLLTGKDNMVVRVTMRRED